MSTQPNSRQLISCEECGLVVRIPDIEQGQKHSVLAVSIR